VIRIADSREQLGGEVGCPGFGWQGSKPVAAICTAVPQTIVGSRPNDFTNDELLLTPEPEYLSSKIEEAKLPCCFMPEKLQYVD
jgi:hypothetical protein